MKKKLARLMASLLGVASLALAGCNTGIKWLDNIICGHDEYAFVRITLEPTCTEEGERLMECVDCGKTKTETMEKIGHDEIVTPGKDATCTEDGYTEKIVCNVCREVLLASEARSAFGHSFENGSCQKCGETLDELVAAEVGELVAGNTYRLYIPSTNDSSNNSLYLSNDTGTYFHISNGRRETSYLWWSGDSGPVYYLEGLEVVKTDMYMEFNLKAGTYKILKSDGTDTEDTYVIDEETSISSIYGDVFRVVDSAA